MDVFQLLHSFEFEDNKIFGSQPSSEVPDKWFSGTVRIAHLFAPTEPARTDGARV